MMIKQINFINNRFRDRCIRYFLIDIVFFVFLAFALLLTCSFIISGVNRESAKVEIYLQSRINQLSSKNSNYKEIQDEHNHLLNTADDLASILYSQYYILLGIEKISQSIVNNIYITKLDYESSTDSILLEGVTTNLRGLSMFMKKLEQSFNTDSVNLENLGPDNSGSRVFSIKFKYINNKDLSGV